MESIEEIEKWFESGKDYKAGVEILTQIHSNKGLIRNLRKVESSLHREIVEYELGKILENLKVEPIEVLPLKVEKTNDVTHSEKPSITEAKITPIEIVEIILKQGKLYNKRCMLSNQLADLPEETSQEDRKALVDQILELVQEYNTLAGIKKEWDRSGKLQDPKPEEKKLSNMAKDQLLLERANLRSNQSKAKKSISKYQHNPAKVHCYKDKEAKIQARLNEIENLLKKG